MEVVVERESVPIGQAILNEQEIRLAVADEPQSRSRGVTERTW